MVEMIVKRIFNGNGEHIRKTAVGCAVVALLAGALSLTMAALSQFAGYAIPFFDPSYANLAFWIAFTLAIVFALASYTLEALSLAAGTSRWSWSEGPYDEDYSLPVERNFNPGAEAAKSWAKAATSYDDLIEAVNAAFADPRNESLSLAAAEKARDMSQDMLECFKATSNIKTIRRCGSVSYCPGERP